MFGLLDSLFGLMLTCVIVVIIFSLLVFLVKRYKKCPSDRVNPRRRGLHLAGDPGL